MPNWGAYQLQSLLHITSALTEVLRSKIWETEVQRGFLLMPVK